VIFQKGASGLKKETNRCHRIIRHPLYCSQMDAISADEKDRIYCGHDLQHALDVARIMRIYNAELALGISVDLIYGAALIHDIGRAVQYRTGIPHDRASAVLAEKILPECGFDETETRQIADAVLRHRENKNGSDTSQTLGTLLCRADKESRLCFLCDAADTCKWPDTKKNRQLRI
jgi:uncharacterized protein